MIMASPKVGSSPPRFYLGESLFKRNQPPLEEEGWKRESMEAEGKTMIVVGIAAMSKKSKSKPMREILQRLEKFEYIVTDVFDEDVILNKPVEEWPHCHCLISFFSKGFPLQKAIDYADLRKPLVINDLHKQFEIQDRRKVYQILKEQGIGLPRYTVLDRDNPEENKVVELEDSVEVNGMVFHKPFVEKPISAEDHHVYIYYPSTAGGGSQRLFRKIGSRSSVYSPESHIRKEGSFIFEEFMPTDGTDVKVYTVGPDYAHAEARKSPALDGKVERDFDGKEIRYPVILSSWEKLIARKVCLAFKQRVCGFDLLRASGKSYVCDVNGFSFVKNSNKYYDDCAKILGNLIMRDVGPRLSIPWNIPLEIEEASFMPTTLGTMMELRCVIAVIRHGDRTPKQKMKMEVKNQKFFDLFARYGGKKSGKIKLKTPRQLQDVLDVARSLLSEIESDGEVDIEEKRSKLEQLKSILEMYGHFSGINRKVQMKYQPYGMPKHSSSEEDVQREPSLLLILKWGGELTPAGKVQAEELGQAFRCIYPGGQGEYAGFAGCGLLRLHSTYRHDLKIYASDEGRVQMTASSFTKGLLALEGELTPILVQMVKSAHTSGLLDYDKDSSATQAQAKERLYEMMRQDKEFDEENIRELCPTQSWSLCNSMRYISNPRKMCEKVYSLLKQLLKQIKQLMHDSSYTDVLYHNETLDLLLRRWTKLEKDFKLKNGQFDITKIPDVYDCIKYDMMHNKIFKQLEGMDTLYTCAQALADVCVPQEYGITKGEKLEIGASICRPLLRKIQTDIQRNVFEDDNTHRLNPKYSHGVLSPGRHVRSRLYFTSESHIHSLINSFRYGGLCNEEDEQWQAATEYLNEVNELNYLSQIVIMMYEDPNKDISDEKRFHIELHFSPGARNMETADGVDEVIKVAESRSSSTGSLLTNKNSENGKGPTDINGGARSSSDDFSVSPCARDPVTRNKADAASSNLPSPQPAMGLRVNSEPNVQLASFEKSLRGQKISCFTLPGIRGKSTYAKVPCIAPLQTLHNSLSVKQMDTFLDRIIATSKRSYVSPSPSPSITPPRPFNTFMPKRVMPPLPLVPQGSENSSNPGSNTSSALPSPTERLSFDSSCVELIGMELPHQVGDRVFTSISGDSSLEYDSLSK